jgi:hypothetical protein
LVAKHLNARELGRADLARSQLTLDDARALGIEFLEAPQVTQLHPSFRSSPALKLNYFDARGKTLNFYRLRYLADADGLARGTKKGTQRYAQPPGTPPQVYFAKAVKSWAAHLEDPALPLHITEGEKKSAAACKAGFLTLGLGGVWCWKSTKRGEALVPELASIAWRDRPVFITFDSDAAENPDIIRAQLALAEMLTSLGARPSLVTIPGAPGGKKVGLDDYLKAKGKKAFDRLLGDAPPFNQARELWAMNGEVVYVRDPGIVVVVDDGRKLHPNAFCAHAYANRHYFETVLTAKGEPRLVKKPLAPAWLAWERRAELERLTYDPGAPRVTDGREYNYWKGWGCDPRKGDVTPWRQLLEFLFKGEKESRSWFERWCAYPLQHPGAKLYTSAVLWGIAHGTGKSFIGYSLLKIYGDNGTEVTEQHLRSNFNEWAESRQFVMGDEITGSEHRREADRLKSFITQRLLRINMKHIPSYTVPDRINYFFTSNHPDSFFMEDADRRMFVHEVVGPPREMAFYKAYEKWLEHHGAAALFHHLLTLPLGDFDPKAAAPVTRSKELMIVDNKSDLGAWVGRLRQDPGHLLRLGDLELPGDLFTNSQLLKVYDPDGKTRVTANGLGRELRRAGFRYVNGGAVVLTMHGPQRLYVLRNEQYWARQKPGAATIHYNQRFGDPEKKEEKYK